jgi:predicted phosphodiesterase
LRRAIRHLILLLAGMGLILESGHAQELLLPLKEKSVRFAVIGDSGTGKKGQYEVAQRMVEYRQRFPFEFVIMLGDNIYGTNSSSAYTDKFELPYKPLLDEGVKFYAALGNHDNPDQRLYKLFNMQNRYYTYTKGDVRLFALDSNYMDPEQLKWLERELQNSGSPWKICYFHHPLYSSGATHGSSTDLRALLEPLFVKYGVNVVFAGHEHFYERIKAQKGIYYFTSGAAGQLRRGNIRYTEMTAKGFDQDLSFMLVEVSGDELHFQVVSRTGSSVDAGLIQRTVSKVISSGPKLGGS